MPMRLELLVSEGDSTFKIFFLDMKTYVTSGKVIKTTEFS